MKCIIVTGSPGTGKSRVARLIAEKLKGEYVDVNKLVKNKKIKSEYDKKLNTRIVDVKVLNKYLINLIKKSKKMLVIDSHLSHYLPKKYVKLCVVTKCELKVLKKRLEKRKYSREKIRDNLDAEIFDVCLIEAKEKCHRIKVIDTTHGIDKRKLFKLVKR